MKNYRIPYSGALLAALVLGVGLVAALPGMSAAAQEDETTTTLTVYVRLCVEAGCTELLEATEPVSGMTVEIADAASGDVLGSCASGEDGSCAVDIPWAESVLLSFDEAAIPDGYEAQNNPEQFQFGTEPMEAVEAPVLFYPVDGFPPEDGEDDNGDTIPPSDAEEGDTSPVDELPETGAGEAVSSNTTLATGALIVAVVLAIAGATVRRNAMLLAAS